MTAVVDIPPVYALEIAHADTRSPYRARRWLACVLEAAQLPQATLEAAVLATSELVTNAAVHAGGRVVVSAQLLAGGVRLVVHDAAPLAGGWQAPADESDERGRGLVIVQALAEQFDIASDTSGTTVMALIPKTED